MFTISELTALDTTTRLTWARAVSPQKLAWDLAVRYCSTLSLAGTGWRLPTLDELNRLVETGYSPCIDPIAFPNTPAGEYWTSTPLLSDVMVVGFYERGAGTQRMPVSTANNVRCVR